MKGLTGVATCMRTGKKGLSKGMAIGKNIFAKLRQGDLATVQL
jgi:hypothetical protein